MYELARGLETNHQRSSACAEGSLAVLEQGRLGIYQKVTAGNFSRCQRKISAGGSGNEEMYQIETLKLAECMIASDGATLQAGRSRVQVPIM